MVAARARHVNSVSAHDCRRTRPNDDNRRRVGLPGRDGLIERLAIIGVVGRNTGDLAFDLPKEGGNLDVLGAALKD